LPLLQQEPPLQSEQQQQQADVRVDGLVDGLVDVPADDRDGLRPYDLIPADDHGVSAPQRRLHQWLPRLRRQPDAATEGDPPGH
jgi:hypothetical protein